MRSATSILVVLLAGLSVIGGAGPVGAAGQRGSFTTESWDSRVSVSADGRVRVEHTIVVDFPEERHGIFLDLPARHLGLTYEYRSIVVRGEQVAVRHGADITRVRIGSPDETVSGRRTYTVSMDVVGAVMGTTALVPIIALQWDGAVGRASVRVGEGSVVPATVRCRMGLALTRDVECPSTGVAIDDFEGLWFALTFEPGEVAALTASRPAPEDVDELLPSEDANPLKQWGFVFAGVLGVLGLSWFFRGSGSGKGRSSDDDRHYDSHRSYDSGSSSDSGSDSGSSGGGGDW